MYEENDGERRYSKIRRLRCSLASHGLSRSCSFDIDKGVESTSCPGDAELVTEA